jgi:hypothetical protein
MAPAVSQKFAGLRIQGSSNLWAASDKFAVSTSLIPCCFAYTSPVAEFAIIAYDQE